MHVKAKKIFITTKKAGPLRESIQPHLPEESRVEVVIQSGGVWLNRQRKVDPDEIIAEKETLIVYITSQQGERYRITKDMIVFQNNEFIVIHKPTGVTTTSDRSNLYVNLTSGVKDYLNDQGNPYNPTPISRLDFMVQGLVLYACHKQAEKDLFNLMQHRKIGKVYHATLHPKENLPNCMRIQDTLSFTTKAKVSQQGKSAHSLFIKQYETSNAAHYTIILFTGRRHQIRCHAAAYLSPIIGDGLYGKRSEHRPISLIAYGYNFNYKNKRYRIRLSKETT